MMRRHRSIGVMWLLALTACSPTAPTTFVDETIDVPWGTLGGDPRRHTYEFGVQTQGFFEITLEQWTWDDNDTFLIELLDAATASTLLQHRSCDPWARFAGARCDSSVEHLPATFGVRVAGGRRVLMRVFHEKGALGFRLSLKRPR
jgi:hypothetical protein